MVKCDDCGLEMHKAKSCTKKEIKINGKWYKRDTDHFDEESGRCHDCGIKHGGIHHWGCDVERCPVCGRQLISCACANDEENIEVR